MSESNCNRSSVGVANKNQIDPASKFYKVNVDCWEKIFDYLGLRDIVTMSKTCRRMQQIGGYYLSEYLPEVQCKWIENRGLYIGYPTSVMGDDLSQFLIKVTIYGYLERTLSTKSYCSLKTLVLRNVEMTDAQIGCLQEILKNIEIVDFRQCIIHDGFHEKFLKSCPKLKQLILSDYSFNLSACSLLQKIYPSLESLELIQCPIDPEESGFLRTFLERNPNVKQISIDMRWLLAHPDSFTNSNIQLDCLKLHSSFEWAFVNTPAAQFVNLLKSLNERSFYKTLHLSLIYADEEADFQELINEMSVLKTLEALTTNQEVEISGLVHLKELCLWGDCSNMELLATNLVNLERLFIYKGTTDDILPFFRHSKRLKTVRVFKLFGTLINDGALNLSLLNVERHKLGATKRVTVCVEEEIYLATKKKQLYANLNLVQVARGESETLGSLDRCYYY